MFCLTHFIQELLQSTCSSGGLPGPDLRLVGRSGIPAQEDVPQDADAAGIVTWSGPGLCRLADLKQNVDGGVHTERRQTCILPGGK